VKLYLQDTAELLVEKPVPMLPWAPQTLH